MKKILTLTILILFLATGLSARTITVTSSADSGAGTLREAVTNAQNGDVIVFAPNVTTVYFAGVINIDKNITISGNETNNTVIQNAPVWTDNVNRKRYFYILEENAEVRFNNLTLKDNQGNCNGGAIANIGKLTLYNCIFSNNRSLRNGGGAIISVGGILIVENCIFNNNYAPSAGGAIDVSTGQLFISNSRFTGNSVPRRTVGEMSGGGAIYTGRDAVASISNCVFEENIASYGGAIINWGAASIDNCNFEKNKATNGGAISSQNRITINNSIFLQNEADYNIFESRPSFLNDGVATFTNCLFTNNTTGSIITHSYGSASTTTELTLINCTIADNTATGLSSGSNYSTTTLHNTILWNNVSDVFQNIDNTNNVIFNAYNSLIGTSNIDLSGNNNIIGENPLFNSDYSLQENSPAIDAGNNSFLSTEITNDLAGNPRIRNNTVDMGAFELQQGTSSVNPVSAENEKTVSGYYSILGTKLPKEPVSGLYIILYSDGSVRKVFVR